MINGLSSMAQGNSSPLRLDWLGLESCSIYSHERTLLESGDSPLHGQRVSSSRRAAKSSSILVSGRLKPRAILLLSSSSSSGNQQRGWVASSRSNELAARARVMLPTRLARLVPINDIGLGAPSRRKTYNERPALWSGAWPTIGEFGDSRPRKLVAAD